MIYVWVALELDGCGQQLDGIAVVLNVVDWRSLTLP